MIGIDSGDADFDYYLVQGFAHGSSTRRLELVLVKKFKFVLLPLQQRRRTTSCFDRSARFDRNRLFQRNGA